MNNIIYFQIDREKNDSDSKDLNSDSKDLKKNLKIFYLDKNLQSCGNLLNIYFKDRTLLKQNNNIKFEILYKELNFSQLLFRNLSFLLNFIFIIYLIFMKFYYYMNNYLISDNNKYLNQYKNGEKLIYNNELFTNKNGDSILFLMNNLFFELFILSFFSSVLVIVTFFIFIFPLYFFKFKNLNKYLYKTFNIFTTLPIILLCTLTLNILNPGKRLSFILFCSIISFITHSYMFIDKVKNILKQKNLVKSKELNIKNYFFITKYILPQIKTTIFSFIRSHFLTVVYIINILTATKSLQVNRNMDNESIYSKFIDLNGLLESIQIVEKIYVNDKDVILSLSFKNKLIIITLMLLFSYQYQKSLQSFFL